MFGFVRDAVFVVAAAASAGVVVAGVHAMLFTDFVSNLLSTRRFIYI